jgi:hypothetical protein
MASSPSLNYQILHANPILLTVERERKGGFVECAELTPEQQKEFPLCQQDQPVVETK